MNDPSKLLFKWMRKAVAEIVEMSIGVAGGDDYDVSLATFMTEAVASTEDVNPKATMQDLGLVRLSEDIVFLIITLSFPPSFSF